MKKLKIGLLPLYVKLYDDYWPEIRERVDAFYRTIVAAFENRGLEVVGTPICAVKPEFAAAVQAFEREETDAIVTLHLAYSPSLESADALAATGLPLIVLDTTPTYDFGTAQHPDEIMYNHGIHGVQDMCNLLIRNGKRFQIEVGHWAESDVLDRVVDGVKAARLAQRLRGARVGAIGRPFPGMGDFQVPADELRSSIGIETVAWDLLDADASEAAPIPDEWIEREIAEDAQRYDANMVDRDTLRQSIRTDLTVRRWIERNGLSAFTVNFLDVGRGTGLSGMPFLEASKAMARGVGYAGEGDVLTAALTGALLSVYPDSSFSEMFCPDWKHNRIFLSHMGEMNVRVAAGKPLLKEKEFPFADADTPVAAYGRFRAGEAVYVNLAPGRHGTYTFILAPIEMCEPDGEDRMTDAIRGWFRPPVPIERFLADYSRLGGTHHGVIVYGDAMNVLERLGEAMGWRTVVIGQQNYVKDAGNGGAI
ncbi:L-arabinose isomerase family protein [Paenibacillus chitinolyticus]